MSGDASLRKEKSLVPGNSQYVKLNVGGRLFYTTLRTLTNHDTMLRSMFSGRMQVLTDPEGWVLVDRDGKHFGTMLNFLRDGDTPLPDNRRDLEELLVEAKFYCIEKLQEMVQQALKPRRTEYQPICRIPLLTSNRELHTILQSTKKEPVVVLILNRHNNKYSYTSQSDDNLLKNLELFDKLALRFHNRIIFLKDVAGGEEICQWVFYGHGVKQAEVSCTSIVYPQEKKLTKVEFHEARIYEETLNILLFEDRNCPNSDALQASRGLVGASHQSDEELEEQQQQPVRGHPRRR